MNVPNILPLEKKPCTAELPKIVKGTGINFLGSISRNILNFLYIFILARLLNTNDLGLYYLGFSVVTIVAIVSLAGTESGIIRFVSIYHGRNDVNRMRSTLYAALIFVVSLSLILSLTLFLSSGAVANSIFSKPALASVLRGFSLYLPFFAIASICLATTQGMKYMQYRVWSMDIVNTLLKLGFFCVFLYFGFRLSGAVFAAVLSIILVAGLSIYFLKKVFPHNRQEKGASMEYRKLLLFSIPQSFSNIINRAVGLTDTLILGYFTIAASVGIYNVTLKIVMLVSCILGAFNTMFSPMIADLHHQGKHDQLEDLYKIITKWIVTLSFPICLFLIFFSNNILKIFGEDFVLGNTCLIILCIGQITNAAAGPSGLMVLMSGHPYVNLFNNILTLILNVGLNISLIPKYGINGAAIATASSMVFINTLRVIQVYYFMKIHPYHLSYLKSLFSAVASILLVALGTDKLVSVNGVWTLGVIFTVFLLVYSTCLVLLRLDSADHFVLSKIKQRLITAK